MSIKVRRSTWLVLLAIVCSTAIGHSAFAAEIERVLLAEGTPHETNVYIQRADEPGPIVLLIGGIHGNEPAGSHAIDVVRYWPIERGTVIAIPHANVKSLAAGTRRIPETPRNQSDLNRVFPKPDAEMPDAPEHPLAKALWELLQTHRPEWVLDCQEGFDFHKQNSKSVGSSVIADKQPETQAMAEAMLAAVNAGIEAEEKHFARLGPLIAGGFARAATEHFKATSMTIETTTKEQRIPVRARQHRQMLHAALAKLDMLNDDIQPDTLLTELCGEDTVDVAIFDDGGVGGSGRARVTKQLADRPGIRTVWVDGKDIRAGSCDQFDVLVFSGGTGSGQSNSLGEEGKQRVKKIVEGGGVYIGICAGAYLSGCGPSYGLELLNVETKSPKWMRGRAEVETELTDDGRQLFGLEDTNRKTILYVNGPVWKSAERKELPEATVLAWYRTETAKNGTPEGIMVDTPALIRGAYGAGTAYAFSCHPEQTDGCEEFVFRAIAASKQLEASATAQ